MVGVMSRTATTPPPELELPENVEQLRAHVEHLRAALAEKDHRLAEREATIEYLSEQLRLAIARRFAPSAERVAEAQLGLFNEAETLDELYGNLREVIEMLLEDGEPALETEFVGTQTLVVA